MADEDPFAVQRRESKRIYEREWKRAAQELGLKPGTKDREQILRIGDKMRHNNPGRY